MEDVKHCLILHLYKFVEKIEGVRVKKKMLWVGSNALMAEWAEILTARLLNLVKNHF